MGGGNGDVIHTVEWNVIRKNGHMIRSCDQKKGHMIRVSVYTSYILAVS